MAHPPSGFPPAQPGAPVGAAPGVRTAPVRRKGTSKAVPVIMSMALAGGTFAGLTLGLGTGSSSEASTGTAANGDAPTEGSASAAPAGSGSASGTSEQASAGSGSEAGSGSGSEAGSGSGSGTEAGTGSAVASGSGSASGTGSASAAGGGSGTAATPAVAKAKLTFDVSPSSAKVTVDGLVVQGGAVEIPLKDGKANVRIIAKASGYKTYDEKVAIAGDKPLEIKLRKRSGGGGGGGGGGDGAGTGGGIIDL